MMHFGLERQELTDLIAAVESRIAELTDELPVLEDKGPNERETARLRLLLSKLEDYRGQAHT